MSRRDDYPAGVPCFVDHLTTDLAAAKEFYGGIFGWDFAGPGPMPGDPPGEYYVARVAGDDVAGVGTVPAGSRDAVPPVWNTHVSVDSAEAAAARAKAAGGAVLAEPFDAPPAGRMAVIADPAGAVLAVWEAGDRAGADVVAAMTAADPAGGMPPSWSVDFWIADADAAAAAAPGLGGRVVAEPFQEASFRRAILAAPDGAVFSVSQLQLSG